MTDTKGPPTTSIEAIEAIDVHGHFGDYRNRPHPLIHQFCSGDLDVVAQRAQLARTAITIVSPLKALTPRIHNDAVTSNEETAQSVPGYSSLRFWVVLDPRKPETLEQAERMLKLPHCVGIKIHPEEHGYPIREHGTQLFEFASRHNAVILTHSGEQNSLPEDFVPFADDFPQVSLILAHLGCGYDGDPSHQVRAIQAARHGNVYVDTSSAQSILPRLIEWAVAAIGSERILYGTDTPLYCTTMQRVRIDLAEISERAKRLILRENALRLLPLESLSLGVFA